MRGRSSIFHPRIVSPPGARLGVRPETRPSLLRVPGEVIRQRLAIPLVRGPYQDNGASPWFATLPLGTPDQSLKIALDTGSNFIWITSSLCAADSCHHYGNGRFVFQNSSTFQWIAQKQKKVDFGPWGSMTVETGQDDIGVPSGDSIPIATYLAADYSGPQFEQLDWDGGIGFPSGSDYADPAVSFFIAELMNVGIIDPAYPYVSFSTDPSTGSGTVLLGGVDVDAIDPFSAIFMPWTPYTALSNVRYIWSTPLYQYAVGQNVIACNKQFCLDSGSSQFKGDNDIMNTTLELINSMQSPDVSLSLGITMDGGVGRILVPPSVYMVKIEAGPHRDCTCPQFNPLGLTDLVLVGSVLMDQVYTVYGYDVTETSDGYYLIPVGMWIFNKKNGPQMIQSRSEKPLTFGPRPMHQV